MTDWQNQPSHSSRLWNFLKPSALLDWWTIGAFAVVIVRLFVARGSLPNILLLFLGPPCLALVIKYCSKRNSTKIVAALFLTLLDVGVIIAGFDRLFPNLGMYSSNPLSAYDKRVLALYVKLHILFIPCILPLFFCARGLLDRYRKSKSKDYDLTPRVDNSMFPGEFYLGLYILGLIIALISGSRWLWGLWQDQQFQPIMGPLP